ncbi:hypothetical protein MCOR27_001220 [Pyricularia oryzae]|uniref:pyridoxal 5'-phosphate synthase n=5 Tax=Pyricularia TaxID=48558 RepID=A0ABQ8NIC6_PYRGI|nr:pyridoxamine 5'-phosphate oxidase [Pyricularia oryzae 70-15]KAH8838933.1 hypothetical protein MCOR01_008177 [Pyricularia oryzae]KAI6297557.1 hypothetical protein MCOR33_006143 [Pyricularia grisea]EHA54702.1 pyridoxamine 5'-phosphate oxidase [Pyricularia oryzae 70-15]KAH9438766.1 hypothetical protein MCOR02_002368 [Pyricularia oryzae]KAI6270646.1 hypothetical protein MCOR26_008152 [Pyricularia oryzae]
MGIITRPLIHLNCSPGRLGALSFRRTMALHPPPNGEKLIFAPSSTATMNSQAEQFLKHERTGLHRSDLDPSSPIRQFHAWFKSALGSDGGDSAAADAATQQPPRVSHPETCTLSTASLPSGRVSARVVYMKELDDKGFVIYSNFGTSRKAFDLFGDGTPSSVGNPWASLTFWWEPLERQVRVEGRAERLTREESQRYYETRVRGSRIGAWASRQSAVLKPEGGAEGGEDDGRAQLDGWVRETEGKFAGVDDIPVPDFWGGLRIVPLRVEFWQGRANRLHDRFVYERADEKDAAWTLERLSP